MYCTPTWTTPTYSCQRVISNWCVIGAMLWSTTFREVYLGQLFTGGNGWTGGSRESQHCWGRNLRSPQARKERWAASAMPCHATASVRLLSREGIGVRPIDHWHGGGGGSSFVENKAAVDHGFWGRPFLRGDQARTSTPKPAVAHCRHRGWWLSSPFPENPPKAAPRQKIGALFFLSLFPCFLLSLSPSLSLSLSLVRTPLAPSPVCALKSQPGRLKCKRY